MTINNNCSINFKAKISDEVKRKLLSQASVSESKRETDKIIQEKLVSLENWYPQDGTLVIASNYKRKRTLGLKISVADGISVSWPIERLKSRTIFSSFLNLREAYLTDTVNTIKYLYSKYGLDVFKNGKIR